VTTAVWLMPGAPRRAHGERARWRVMYGYVRPHRLALLASRSSACLPRQLVALPLVVRALIGALGNHRAVAGAGRTRA
jgi:hypothetical protein